MSEVLREDFLEQFSSLAKSETLTAHDGADAPSGATEEASLSGEFKVGYLGHLYPGKGMEIISKLAARCSYAHFHVVGGREKDLMNWKPQLASIPNITLHGFVPHRETPSYLLAFDVVLAPYQPQVEAASGMDIGRWMSPLKLFEYMSIGKPIIASDLAVLREVLEHKRNALLVPANDPDAWAEAVKLLRDNVALRQRISRQALRDFQEKYSWESRAGAVLDGL